MEVSPVSLCLCKIRESLRCIDELESERLCLAQTVASPSATGPDETDFYAAFEKAAVPLAVFNGLGELLDWNAKFRDFSGFAELPTVFSLTTAKELSHFIDALRNISHLPLRLKAFAKVDATGHRRPISIAVARPRDDVLFVYGLVAPTSS